MSAHDPNLSPAELELHLYDDPEGVLSNPALPLLLLENPSWPIRRVARVLILYRHLRMTHGFPDMASAQALDSAKAVERTINDHTNASCVELELWGLDHMEAAESAGIWNEGQSTIQRVVPYWLTAFGVHLQAEGGNLMAVNRTYGQELAFFVRGAWGKGEI